MFCVTLVVPMPAEVIVANTVYWPVTSGRRTTREATCNVRRSATLYVGTLVPSGLAVSAATDPIGLLVKTQVTVSVLEAGMAMFTRASR